MEEAPHAAEIPAPAAGDRGARNFYRLLGGPFAFPGKAGIGLAGLALFAGLYLAGRTNPLLFHTISELLHILIAGGIFIEAWHGRHCRRDSFFLIIGIGSLLVGGLGLLHASSYQGAAFPALERSNLQSQLQVTTGLLEGATLLAAALLLGRTIRTGFLFAGLGLPAGLAIAAIFLWHLFPQAYQPGTGLTPFARGATAVAVLLPLAAAALLARRRQQLSASVSPYLFAALGLAVLTELTFMPAALPASRGPFHHFFKIASFACLYLAVTRSRFQQTYGLLLEQLKKEEEAILQAGREWRRTFDAVPDLIAILGTDHRVRRVNWAMAAQFDKHPRELIGKQCFEFMHRASHPIHGCPLGQTLADGQPHTSEIYEPTLDRYFLVHVVPLQNDRGEIDGAVHVARDITESKRAEQSLRESEERYRILFGQAADLLFLYHLDEQGNPGPLLEVNEATCRTLGYTREEIGRLCLPDLCEKGPEGKPCPATARLPDGQGGLVTLMLVAKNGMRILVEASGHLFDFQGRPTVLSVARDITERKVMELELQRYQGRLENLVREKTAELVDMNESLRKEVQERKEVEETLRESEQHLRRLIEEFNGLLAAIPDTLILVSPELEVLWTNKAPEGGVRPDRRTLPDHACFKLWGEHPAHCTDCPTRRSFSSGRPEHAEVSSPEGRTWEIWAFPIKNQEGKPTKVIETVTEITEKMTLQAEAIRAAHLASLGELAAGVAHEINNPINGIINYAQLIFNRADQESREHDIARRIIKEGDRIAVIVRSLLSFARAKREEKKTVHIREILLDTLTLTEAQLRRDFITLETRLPREPLIVFANGSQLEQVFLNLINNARYALNQKYSEPHADKRLEISGERVELTEGPHVRLTFHDHGTGIPPAIRDQVMNPFFSSKPTEKGTGLGLSISHGIITDHGGRITIDTAEGEYTKFIIDLPAGGIHAPGRNPSPP